jgi:cytochrome d ubiquinol oxidase subunit II
MIAFWYAIAAVAVAVYVALDGFDFGAGIIAPFVARSESERTEVLEAIGPFWNGNEVWLLAGGGTLLMAFPVAFAAGFSGLYLPLTILLWLLILRGMSMELRSHVDNPLWRTFWDRLLTLVSLLIAIVFGAALGIVIRGVPLDESGQFLLGLFGGAGGGVLNPYTVFVGVVAAVLLAQHGAQFLAWRGGGLVQARSQQLAAKLLPASVILLIAGAVATAFVQPPLWSAMLSRPLAWPLVSGAVLAVAICGYGNWRRRPGAAFAGSALTLVFILAASAAAEFPILLRSTVGPQFNIEAAGAAAGPHSLLAASVWWPLGLLLSAAYTAALFRVFRGARKV